MPTKSPYEEEMQKANQGSASQPKSPTLKLPTDGQRQTANAYQPQTFQTPGGAQPGQQSSMPWSSGGNPATGFMGGSSTPWAQNLSAFNQAQASQANALQANQNAFSQANSANSANAAMNQNAFNAAMGGGGGGGFGGMLPNWGALAQRFGGGGAQQAALPFMGGAQMGGGAQSSPWLQNLMQGLAQRFAALRAGGPQGGAGSMNPQQRPGFWSGTPRM